MIKASLHHSSISSRDIALLLAVAEGGSIRRAADTIGIAQPSLSKSIRLIEERLGVSLFERSTSGAQPTPLGGDLLARGRQVLLDLAAIQRDLTDALCNDSGRVRLGVGALVAPFVSAPMVKLIRAELPNIDLDVRQLSPSDILSGIEGGTLDFGVCQVDPSQLRPALRSKAVSRLPTLFFARRGHPLDGHLVRPARLAEYPLALPHSDPRFEAWFRAFTGHACHVATQGHGFDLIGDLVEQSDDISIGTPRTFDRLRRHFDVAQLNVPGVDFRQEIHAVVPAARPLSAAAQRVCSVVERVMAELAEVPVNPVCSAASRLPSRLGYHPIDSRQLRPARAAA